MSFENKKIVIIGGGPAGCAAAAYALRNGFEDVTVIEASDTLGGLHKDVQINGLHFDLGAFFFWRHHQIISLFPGLMDMLVYAESSRHLSLTNRFNLDQYPLTLKSYLKENGYFSTIADGVKLLVNRMILWRKPKNNAQDILTYYMGPFYKKSGLKNYIQRLYGIDPELVNVEFTQKRLGNVIRKFRLKEMLKAFLRGNMGYFKSYEIIKDVWARPEAGFETMYGYIQSELVNANGRIILNQKVEKIDLQNKTLTTSTGDNFAYDYLLSSQPLSATAGMCGLARDFNLKYRPLCSLFYEAPEVTFENCFVLFNFSEKGKWKRVTLHSNYYNQDKAADEKRRHYFVVESMPDVFELNKSSLADELDMDFRDSFCNSKWRDKMARLKLVGYHITKNAYPIFDLEFDRSNVVRFKEQMKMYDVFVIGRQGEFEHNSSSDASRSALLALDEIMKKDDAPAMQHAEKATALF